MEIEDAVNVVMKFMELTLKKKGVIIETAKDEEGWKALVEVIEESEFIKALKMPTVVQERYCYEIKLNGALDVVSYRRAEKGREFS